VLKIPLNPPHVPQLHVVHSPHAIHAHPANHSDDSQILFLSVDNTPASAKGFQNEGLAILDHHAEPIPAAQLFCGFVRPRDCVLQAHPISAGSRRLTVIPSAPIFVLNAVPSSVHSL